MILKSRFVVPVDRPVLRDGAVRVHDGLIADVGLASDVTGAAAIDYADAVICPGFVNAHTHLELTHLQGKIAPSADFTGWLRQVVQVSIDSPPNGDELAIVVEAGIRQSLESGVTTVGDITRNPACVRNVFANSLIRAVSFGEVAAVGNRRHLLKERMDTALDDGCASPRLSPGVSPHAPYSVEPDGLRFCAQQAADRNRRLCIHLAETCDEAIFTLSREGAFVKYLQDVGVWNDDIPIAGLRPVHLARLTGILGTKALAAHANYVSDDDIATLANTGTSVAYCPRTHHAFGHSPHRYPDMLKAGVNVCIGTDSLASNPSLSVLDDLRFLRRARPETSADVLMAMGTIHGARALGFDKQCGTIAPGKAADIVVIPLDSRTKKPDWKQVFDTDLAPTAVYVSGVRYRPPR